MKVMKIDSFNVFCSDLTSLNMVVLVSDVLSHLLSA